MSRWLLVTSEYPPMLGGVAAYYFGLASSLQDVTVLTNAVGARGANVRRTGWAWPGWPRWLPLLWVVPQWKRKEKCELLAAGQLLPIGTAMYIMHRAFGWPYLVFLHGLDVRLSQRSPWKKRLTRLILSNAALTIANSQFTLDLAMSAGARSDCSAVVYPATDLIVAPEAAAEGIKQRYGITGKRVILTVARLVARKGVDNVIGAVRQLMAKYPDLVYVVIGDGPEKANLERQAEGVPVVFTGSVSDAERNAWYRACEVFVLTPIPDATDVEGFGIVYLEAMAAAKPIIATTAGGVPEAVGEAGVMIRNFGELDESLERLMDDAGERNRLGQLGLQRVRRFTWPKQAEVLLGQIKKRLAC